jgi:hypothetical protein
MCIVIMANVKVCATVLALLVIAVFPSKVNCYNLSNVFPATNSTTLYFGLMLSLSGDDQSSGALAGVQAALDEINSRDDLLPGYSLNFTLTDSQVFMFID